MGRPHDKSSDRHKTCPTCQTGFVCKPSRDKTYCSKKCAANSPKVKSKNRCAVAKTFKAKYGCHPMKLKEREKVKPPILAKTSTLLHEVKQFVSSISQVSEDKSALFPIDVDIFVPQKHIAIEVVEISQHSEVVGGKHKNYHLNRTKIASMKGIRLIHVFGNEWFEHKDVVQSILKSLLTTTNIKLHAKRCEVKELKSEPKNEFLAANHIKGEDRADIKVGLFHGKEIVSVMTLNKKRFGSREGLEVSRFCSKNGYTIVGGASKIFSHVVNNYSPSQVVAYCDRRYFSGEMFLKLGFQFVNNTPPAYHYIVESYNQLDSRNNWRKDMLKHKLAQFQVKLSEWENMKMNGFDRIWDCGHSKWVWTIK